MKKYGPLLMILSLVVASLACKGALEDEDPFGFDLGDRVWEDVNANGIQDPDEPGVAGVRVLLVDADTGEIISFTDTDAAGKYVFLMTVPRKNLLIEFHPPAGYFFTQKDAGTNDEIDSDADPTTGQIGPFDPEFREDLTRDAGLIAEFLPPESPTPEEPPPAATAMPTEPVSSGGDEPTALITTNSGCEVAYYGPTEAVHGEMLEVMFGVMCNGSPGMGTFFATLGDPPTSSDATHANGELDADGMVTLMLDVNWPVGMTTLFFSYERTVYEAAMMTIK